MVTEGVSKPKNVTTSPVFRVEQSEKSILEALKPCFTPKNAFYSPFEGLFEVAAMGRKWGHLGRKIDFFVFDPESDL